MPGVLVAFSLAASGCGAAIVMAGEATVSGAAGQAVRAGEDQERRANAEANVAAERKRQDENAQIRATGELLEREEPSPVITAGDLPEHLDRAMITAAINSAKADVAGCGTPQVHARIVLTVKVSGAGGVESVEIAPTPHATLADCVATAIRRAAFARTRRGGTFAYPFVF